MIKVIASDMDGTLLGADHRLDKRTLSAIHKAQAAGIRFMLATGRNYNGAINALGELDTQLTCDYLVGSGAEVRNPQREIIRQVAIEDSLCMELYEKLKKYPVSVIFCTNEGDFQIGTPEEIEESTIVHLELFYVNMTRDELLQSDSYRKLKENTHVLRDYAQLQELNIPVFKLFIFAQDVKMLGKIKEELGGDERIAIASSFSTNLEITDVRAQKGPVLKEYIESLGYTMDEVMVFGDSLNDYSMLSMDFGATIAMENADPEVKAVAKYMTKSNTESGVAYAIEKLLEKQVRE